MLIKNSPRKLRLLLITLSVFSTAARTKVLTALLPLSSFEPIMHSEPVSFYKNVSLSIESLKSPLRCQRGPQTPEWLPETPIFIVRQINWPLFALLDCKSGAPLKYLHPLV